MLKLQKFRIVLATSVVLGLGFADSLTVYCQAPKTTTPSTQDWPVINGQDSQQHYSKLAQINRDNVKNLVVAWKYDTGEKGGIEVNPIIVGQGSLCLHAGPQRDRARCSHGQADLEVRIRS